MKVACFCLAWLQSLVKKKLSCGVGGDALACIILTTSLFGDASYNSGKMK
jgi:hypothetical protein